MGCKTQTNHFTASKGQWRHSLIVMVAYRYQREFTYDQLIVNVFRRCFFSLKKSDSLKVE